MSVRLYLDEDVDVRLALLLRAKSHDCLTTLDANRLADDDEAQLAFAATEGRILLTHNREDFAALAVAWHQTGRSHAGILMMFQRRSLSTLAGQADEILQLYDQQAWRDLALFA